MKKIILNRWWYRGFTILGVILFIGLFIWVQEDTNPGINNKSSEESEVVEQTVYICTGPMSTKYHFTSDCKGLTHCSGEIEEVTLSQAEEDERGLCGFCQNSEGEYDPAECD